MLDLDILKNLRDIRRRNNISQKAFAKKVGTSQGTIAKIENETLEPSLQLVRRILHEITSLQQESDAVHVKDIMVRDVISFKPNTKLTDVIEAFRDRGISQAPVVDKGGRLVGSVSETSIIVKAIGKDVSMLRVWQVMDDVFPTVPPSAKLREIRYILHEYSAVLVLSRGKLRGIVTPSDLVYKLELFG